MVSIADAIHALHPEADPARDFAVADGGDGPRVVHWNADKLGPEPTAEALAAVTPEQVAAATIGESVKRALMAVMVGTTPAEVANRVILRYTLTLVNDLRERMGLSRVQEADHVKGIKKLIAEGGAGVVGGANGK